MTISKEDLKKRDYVLVLDRSGSMSEAVSRKNPQSKWNAMKEVTMAVARKCQEFDSDGIDLYMFNTSFKKFENTTPDKVQEIFDTVGPNGGTDFVPVLTEVINVHFSRANKPTTVFVVTDGCPSDAVNGQKDLAKLITKTTQKLESGDELGIEFLQVGDDAAARDFLKNLDEGLEKAGAKHDIVNTKTCDDLADLSIEDVLLAAVNE
jgi:hypothetical protein